jgi:hypothetical protein
MQIVRTNKGQSISNKNIVNVVINTEKKTRRRRTVKPKQGNATPSLPTHVSNADVLSHFSVGSPQIQRPVEDTTRIRPPVFISEGTSRPEVNLDDEPSVEPEAEFQPNQPEEENQQTQPEEEYGPNQPEEEYGPNQPEEEYGPSQPEEEYGPTQPEEEYEPTQPDEENSVDEERSNDDDTSTQEELSAEELEKLQKKELEKLQKREKQNAYQREYRSRNRERNLMADEDSPQQREFQRRVRVISQSAKAKKRSEEK